jgi:hypothetical protein
MCALAPARYLSPASGCTANERATQGAESRAQPARYGPFHRLASPTQTRAEAAAQQESGEIWGRTPRTGAWPQVNAYSGPLPDGEFGIEFYTNVPPDEGERSPVHHWSGPPQPGGARIDGDFAKIQVVISRIQYPDVFG